MVQTISATKRLTIIRVLAMGCALVCALCSAMGVASAAQQTPAQTRPRVRTVTAFIRMDRQNYKAQVADALKMLNAAKAEFVKAGYVVETVRITNSALAALSIFSASATWAL